MSKKLTIGLFGFGVVGQGLYNVLNQTHGVKAEVKRIAIKDKSKNRSLPQELFTTNKNEILDDPFIDIVVELINDHEAAYAIVKEAIEKGKHVVTANKRMLAENLEEFYELQKLHNKSILYEGSVCGSIPIIRNLEEYYDNDLLTSIEGIFNGSTNYILTKVFEERKSYAEALQKAQELGFAETEPALDVEGFDAKFKLVIAIAHTFGVFVKPSEVINIGINKISATDLKYAKENNLTIKLVARSFKHGEKVFGFVAPQFVDAYHPLASIRNEYNAVLVEGAFADKQTFVGKGAGSYPTGSAVLSDVSALTYGYAYEYKKRAQHDILSFSNDLLVDAVVSFEEEGSVSFKDFEIFKSGYAANGKQSLQGTLTLARFKELSELEGVSVLLAANANFIPKSEVAINAVLAS